MEAARKKWAEANHAATEADNKRKNAEGLVAAAQKKLAELQKAI